MTVLTELVAEQWEYRELLVRMTARDLLLRYKQTVMGFGWAIFMPLVNTAIFSVIFTRVAAIDVGQPYPVYAFCGLLAWNFCATSVFVTSPYEWRALVCCSWSCKAATFLAAAETMAVSASTST